MVLASVRLEQNGLGVSYGCLIGSITVQFDRPSQGQLRIENGVEGQRLELLCKYQMQASSFYCNLDNE